MSLDTCELRVLSSDLAEALVNAEALGSCEARHRDADGCPERLRSGYNQQITTKIDGKTFFLAYSPRSHRQPPALLQFHLSQFRNWDEFETWMIRLIGTGRYRELKASSTVSRLDFVIDVALPFEEIQQSISRKGATTISNWESSGGRTLYLGKSPQRVRIYEKRDLPSAGVDYWPSSLPVLPYPRSHVTRIEVELRGSKVPVRTLGDLPALKGYRAFTGVTLDPVVVSLIRFVESNRKRAFLQGFLYRVQQVGLAAARKEFDSGGNFSRIIAPYLGSHELDLQKTLDERSERFFGSRTPREVA